MVLQNLHLQWEEALSQVYFYTKYSQCLVVTNDGVKQLASLAASEAQLNMFFQV